MSERSLFQSQARRENVCIDANRIMDSCRDKDCFEDVQLLLSETGQEIVETASSVRVKETKIVGCNIIADPIQFNRGFYQITVRMFTLVKCEACVVIGQPEEFCGIAVTEKKVVLFGSEGGVRVFKNNARNGFCGLPGRAEEGWNSPTVVVEAVDPIALTAKIKEKCHCHGHCHCACSPCCGIDELPESVSNLFGGSLRAQGENTQKGLYVTLGFFSVIRVERSGQFIIQATDYSIPEKQCVITGDEEPCKVFEKMAFPVSEFSPPALGQIGSGTGITGNPCGTCR